MTPNADLSRHWKTMRRLTVAVVVAAAAMLADRSEAACTKPAAPACAVQDGGFSGLNEFDQCRIQMLAYRDGVDAYVTCSQQDAQKSQDEQLVRNEYEDIRQQFNRRARATPE